MWVNILVRTLATVALFDFFSVPLGEGALIFGMVYNFIPFMIYPIYNTLQKMDHSYIEAAQDLGCSPVSAFFKVVLPEILPGVISGFLMSFTFSLDDFVISYFTSGATSQTLPITIYSMTRRKVSPEINALSTIIFVIVVIVLVVKNVIERRNAVKRGVK